jgi:hypothetical protein
MTTHLTALRLSTDRARERERARARAIISANWLMGQMPPECDPLVARERRIAWDEVVGR